MIYDVIIIGAGAAGLYTAAHLPPDCRTLVLEGQSSPGKKLLLTGSGQCNLTHEGTIKEFPDHYGLHGALIRTLLYKHSNRAVMRFFEDHGVKLTVRDDGKVFPASMQSRDVLNCLMQVCRQNETDFRWREKAVALLSDTDIGLYTVKTTGAAYQAAAVIVATGGASWTSTGSDGAFHGALARLGLPIVPFRPALTQIQVKGYRWRELAGIALAGVQTTIRKEKRPPAKNQGITTLPPDGLPQAYTLTDHVLLTHKTFSGPSILNLARYAQPGDTLVFNYVPGIQAVALARRLTKQASCSKKQIVSILEACFDQLDSDAAETEAIDGEIPPMRFFPERFLLAICRQAGLTGKEKAATLAGADWRKISEALTCDEYVISGLGSFQEAMVSCGGVALHAVKSTVPESREYPNLYIIGEALDIDGDTGGYNLQFAFSSARAAADAAAAKAPQLRLQTDPDSFTPE